MSDVTSSAATEIAPDTRKDDLFELLARNDAGERVEGLTVLEIDGVPAVLVPDNVALNRPLVLGDDLLFVQEDEALFVLRGGAQDGYVLLLGDASLIPAALRDVALPEADWTVLGDAPVVALEGLPEAAVERGDGSGEQARVSVNDPLDGLAISPLLRYTEYDFPVFEEEEPGLGGSLPDIVITFPGGAANILLAETDAELGLRFSDFFDVGVGGPGEELVAVGIVLPGLPAGTTANGGRFETASDGTVTFIFEGPPSQFGGLTVTLPPDASTDSRTDTTPGDLGGTVYGVSNFGRGPDQDFSVRVTPEADLDMTGEGEVSLTETDAVVEFRPADAVLPAATDSDGSEVIETVTLELTGLPEGTSVSGGTLVTQPDGSLTLEFEGTLEEYEALTVTLPADFSTTNPGATFPGSDTITGTVTATTNEGGEDTRDFNVVVEETPDVMIAAPDVLRAEDSGTDDSDTPVIVDGSGVTANLGLDIAVDDVDGSENNANSKVTITFTDLPANSGVSTGSLTGSVWTGTVDEANALNLILPGDYSGTVTSVISVETPEGPVTANQTITVNPTPDIGFTVPELVTDETDDAVTVTPSASWTPFIVDNDGSESIEEVTLTLNDLPPDVTFDFGTQPPGTVTYDPTDGGTFTFTGSLDQYNALTLTFPADYSTTSRDGFDPTTEPALTGKLAARSNESAPGDFDEASVSLRINSEQDLEFVTNDLTIAETDAAIEIVPLDVVRPQAVDADDSETVETVTLTATGLPSGTEISLDGGATFTVIDDGDLGQPFSGAADDYANVVLRLPADFATDPGTPIELTVEAATNEGTGTASASANVTVPVEGDIEVTGSGAVFALTENDDATADDDGDTSPTTPVTFTPGTQLTAAGADADGSDTIARVDLTLTGLPKDTTFSHNAVVFDADTGIATFTGSYADYLKLVVTLPDDFSTSSRGGEQGAPGDIVGDVIFTTNEAIAAREGGPDGDDPDASDSDGVALGSFTVTVAPEADIRLTADAGRGVEDTVSVTDPIPLNLNVQITDEDDSETLIDTGNDLSVTFADLPPDGITLSDGTTITTDSPTWTGTAAEMRLLEITAINTEHFSGTITATLNAKTNESGDDGVSQTFEIDITPVAEPTITLSVDASEANVVATDPDNDPATDNFSVKEDTSFLLTIDASTPDKDGSERLTQIVIENIPEGWLPQGDVSGQFENGAGIDSAELSGTTLTIILETDPGLDAFTDAIRLTPGTNDDRDVATLLNGNDLVATVTAEDTAPGLTTDTQTAQDGVDVDIDAVVDGLTVDPPDNGTTRTENTDAARNIPVRLTGFRLQDTDGSEVFQEVRIHLDVVSTESDGFDPAVLGLRVTGNQSRFVEITGNATDGFVILPDGDPSANQFAGAIRNLQVVAPQWFSGQIEVQGEAFWQETTTPTTSPGDQENDISAADNEASEEFETTLTVRPRPEAELTASVFVRDPDFVDGGSPERVEQSVVQGSETNSQVLTLLESTDDGTGPDGQVSVFVGIDARTPDPDGSEQLDRVVISNVPSSWIDFVGDPMEALRSPDGSGPLEPAERDKIASISFNDDDQLIIMFKVPPVPDDGTPPVTSFNAALELQPSLYEDYDVDGQDLTDPFTADGRFLGDLNVALTVSDSNGIQDASETVSATFDIDVEPVNNLPVLDLPTGREDEVDAANGTFQIPITVTLPDTDGTESITSVVLRDVPEGYTIYVEADPANPTGVKVPALLTKAGGNGTTTWSLERGQWETAEIRGVDTHFAGDIKIGIGVVTTEANGRIETFDLGTKDFTVYAVADGGTPGGSAGTREDTAVQVNLNANLIDGVDMSSEQIIDDSLILSGVTPDSEGRFPEFYLGNPGAGGQLLRIDGGRILFDDGTTLRQLTWTEAQNLWVQPATDSNETITFDISLSYEETTPVDPATPGDATATGSGTVTISVTGVADTPSVTAQDPDSSSFNGTIDPVFDGNQDKLFAYAGLDNTPFTLDQRLTDAALGQSSFNAGSFEGGVTPLGGEGQESLAPDGAQDGSETIYYLITGFPGVGLDANGDPDPTQLPDLALLGVQPSDANGTSYLVTAEQLATLEVISGNVDAPTFYDLTLNVIAVEDDQSLAALANVDLDDLNDLDGVAVSSQDFSIVVLPDGDSSTGGGGPGGPGGPGGDPDTCPLVIPDLALVPQTEGEVILEDGETAFKISLIPNGDFADLGDLVELPKNRVGDFTLSLDLPEGSELRSDVPGAVLFDPISGKYVVDFAKLGGLNGTLTEATLFFTPPENVSSPAGPEDGLTGIGTTVILNDFTCGSRQFDDSGTLPLNITPVADGPTIAIANPAGPEFEDAPFDLTVNIGLEDEGETIEGDFVIKLDEGAILLDANGAPLPTNTDGEYVIPQESDLVTDNGDGSFTINAQVKPPAHYSGPLTATVTATTDDLGVDSATVDVTATFQIEAVADTPFFSNPDGTDFVSGGTLTATEDVPFTLRDVIDAGSPDTDGSEVVSYVIGHREGLDLRDIFVLDGPGNGIIDNGDGTFTVSAEAYETLTLQLINEHDSAGDDGVPDAIPLTLTVNTFELSNNDETSGSVDFDLVIAPVADMPTLTAEIDRNAGVEDDGQPFTLTLSATSPDPDETIDFVIENLPDGATVSVGGVPQTVTGGSVTIPGTADADGTFAPAGEVTVEMPEDFSGAFDLSVTAVSSDTGGGITDTADSVAEVFPITIAPAPDITLTADPMDVDHTGAPLVFDLALDSAISDPDEVLDEVVITFDTALPVGTIDSAGALSPDRTTITLNAANTAGAGGIAMVLAALTLTLPADFAGVIAGEVTATTSDGAATKVTFSAAVTNDPPVVPGPVTIDPVDGQTVFTIPTAELLANATDDGPVVLANPGTDDGDVAVALVADGIEVTVPAGYQGMPVLTYDIVDAAGAATSTGTTLDIDTVQMVATGDTVTAPDGSGRSYALLGDVSGDGDDVATGTDQGDAVVFDGTDRDYAGIAGFDMLGGDDLVDLTGATTGFDIRLGAGDDIAIGGDGDDRIDGGLGADTLTGGAGDDIFVLSEGIGMADVITDYGNGADQIDLSGVVHLLDGESIGDRASIDSDGNLTIDSQAAATVTGAMPGSVEVIFLDAQGQTAMATI